MIRPVVFAALLSISVLPIANAADSGQAAPPGQAASPGQPAQPGQAPTDSGEAAAEPEVAATSPVDAAAMSFADGITVEEVAELVRDAGYRAEVKVDDSNMPYVSSRAGGLNYWINLYGCDGEPQRCWDVEFQTSLETTPEEQVKAEQWAVDKVFGKAYIIDATTYFTLPIRLAGGITPENFISNIELWDTVMSDFTDYIGWK